MTHDDARDDAPAADPASPEDFDQPMAELAALAFLRPDDATTEPIPAWAWDRIEAALTAESRERAGADVASISADVVPISAASGRSSHRTAYRWAGGLVAASLAVVVGGVVLTAVRTSSTGGSEVAAVAFSAVQTSAADAAEAPAAGDSMAVAEAAPAPSAVPSDAVPSALAATDAGVSPATKLGGSDWVQPARLVLASGTDYTPASLRSQVTDLLDDVGVDNADEAQAMPVAASLAAVGTGGFTSSMTTLRECITALTDSSQSQALVVDRATYQGNDAGVVVAPTYDGTAATTSPAPTTTVVTDMGELDVWVVNPDCSVVDPRVLLHVLHHWAS